MDDDSHFLDAVKATAAGRAACTVQLTPPPNIPGVRSKVQRAGWYNSYLRMLPKEFPNDQWSVRTDYEIVLFILPYG